MSTSDPVVSTKARWPKQSNIMISWASASLRCRPYGLPQVRKRVYIVGVHETVGNKKSMDITMELLKSVFPLGHKPATVQMLSEYLGKTHPKNNLQRGPPASKDLRPGTGQGGQPGAARDGQGGQPGMGQGGSNRAGSEQDGH